MILLGRFPIRIVFGVNIAGAIGDGFTIIATDGFDHGDNIG